MSIVAGALFSTMFSLLYWDGGGGVGVGVGVGGE